MHVLVLKFISPNLSSGLKKQADFDNFTHLFVHGFFFQKWHILT